MSTIESYDGLCGIIHLSSTSDQRVRCKYELGHTGPHSWDKYDHQGGCCIIKGLFTHTVEKYTQTKK